MEFTKEQLIAHITAKAARIKPDTQVNNSLRIEALMNKREMEIALASLTVPVDIWDLCRKSILPPEPCPRCGTVSDRPDGAHYCHSRG